MIGRRKSPDGLPFNLYKTTGKRIVSFGYKGKDGKYIFRLRAPRARKDLVEKIRSEAIQRANELNGDFPKDDTVAHWFKQYFDWQEGLQRDDERRKADSTLDGNKQEEKNLIAYFGKMLPVSIRAKHLYEYLDIRASLGAPAKANKEIALLSAVLEFTRRKGVIETNPCVAIDYNPVRPKDRLVTAEELDFAVNIARQYGNQLLVQALCARAAYLLVARPDEIRYLRRQNLKDDGIEIPIGKRKAGRVQRHKLIEWSDALRGVINEALSIQRTAGIFVFGNMQGQPYTRFAWSNNWRRLMGYCVKAAKEEEVRFEKFALSDMRPRAVTKRMEGGDATITDATGHSDRKTVDKTYDRRRIRRSKATE